GGSLAYRWEGRRLAHAAWTDAAGRTQVLLRRPADGGPGYEHGNGLRTLGWLRDGRLAGLVVAGPAGRHPVFAQLLAYDGRGRVARDSVLGAGADGTTAYAYDDASRLAVAMRLPPGADAAGQSSAGGAGRSFYAWRDDGSALHAPAPQRDAAGLPV